MGEHDGSLSAVRLDGLGAVLLKALIERTGVPPEEVGDVHFGCAHQAGEDNHKVGRMGLPLTRFPEGVKEGARLGMRTDKKVKPSSQ